MGSLRSAWPDRFCAPAAGLVSDTVRGRADSYVEAELRLRVLDRRVRDQDFPDRIGELDRHRLRLAEPASVVVQLREAKDVGRDLLDVSVAALERGET